VAGESTTTAATTQQQQPQQQQSDPQSKIKQLSSTAERLGCTLHQLAVAWTVRNQTSQSCIISASTPEQMTELINSLAVSKLANKQITSRFRC